MNGSSELTWPTSLNAALPCAAGAQDVEGGIGIAAQAVARDAIDHPFGHQLGDDVQASCQQIGRCVGIVCRNVMLLRERDMQPFSRQEEKLVHLDIGRQRTRMQRAGISEIGIATEQTVDHRRNEAPFQKIRRDRLFQRQRRKKCQIDTAIGGGARIERVNDVVGLAEPQWQADHQIGSDVTNNILGDRLGVGEYLRH